MGLVKLALAARTKRAIQKLTQTYLTLSLADITAQTGLPSAADAEAHILQCATSCMVAAMHHAFLTLWHLPLARGAHAWASW